MEDVEEGGENDECEGGEMDDDVNSPVKFFCPHLPLPGQPRGQRKNLSDKKGRGIWKKRDNGLYIGRGKAKI